MKKFMLLFLLAVVCSIPTPVQAELHTVTIKWTMSDTNDITLWRIYYADNSTMLNKTLLRESTNPTENPANTFTLTCPNTDLENNKTYYFSVAAVKQDGTEIGSDTFSAIYAAPTAPSPPGPVQDFRREATPLEEVQPPPTANADYAINFQPANAPVPEGYAVDSGRPFTEAQGYGWTIGPDSLGPQDRNRPESLNQAYDTMIHVNPSSKWEMILPNGNYTVTICLGDPAFPDVTLNVQLEGITIVSKERLSSSNRWVTKTINTNVTDGKLTITFEGSWQYAKLCWIQITSN